ncbi:MAG: multiheme c-type cytochrome, partial [Candidatus Methylomirabilales bacterium]
MRAHFAGLLATLLLGLLAGGGGSRAASPEAPGAGAAQIFLDRHWTVLVPLQGPPPSGFSPLEASLAPDACGACHAPQYADWKTSLHGQS